ncbi:hypothetical protein KAW65_01640 [candidate division WOR-3 bacterium]|nr:hypothetical protein [candidate division WOR-3 bacterium]
MKKYLAFLGIFILIIGFCGCKETFNPEEPTPLASPTNLGIVVAGSDSLSLKLTWTASSDEVDGYYIYFDGAVLDTTTATTYTDTATSLGDYKVSAYKGTKESAPTDIMSTKLVETVNPVGPVWWMAAPTDTGPSGYGWADNGTGNTYSMADSTAATAKAMVDFYMDSVGLVKGTDKIISPDNLYGNGWNATCFYDFGGNVYDTVSVVPGWGCWMNYAEITALNSTYALFVKDKYFLKIKITERQSSGHHYIKFLYGFQPIAGFRRLK